METTNISKISLKRFEKLIGAPIDPFARNNVGIPIDIKFPTNKQINESENYFNHFEQRLKDSKGKADQIKILTKQKNKANNNARMQKLREKLGHNVRVHFNVWNKIAQDYQKLIEKLKNK